jgi:hypothetical protein
MEHRCLVSTTSERVVRRETAYTVNIRMRVVGIRVISGAGAIRELYGNLLGVLKHSQQRLAQKIITTHPKYPSTKYLATTIPIHGICAASQPHPACCNRSVQSQCVGVIVIFLSRKLETNRPCWHKRGQESSSRAARFDRAEISGAQ